MDPQLSILLSASRIWSVEGAHWTLFSRCPCITRAHGCPLKSSAAFHIQVLTTGVWTWTENCGIVHTLKSEWKIYNLEVHSGKYLVFSDFEMLHVVQISVTNMITFSLKLFDKDIKILSLFWSHNVLFSLKFLFYLFIQARTVNLEQEQYKWLEKTSDCKEKRFYLFYYYNCRSVHMVLNCTEEREENGGLFKKLAYEKKMILIWICLSELTCFQPEFLLLNQISDGQKCF